MTDTRRGINGLVSMRWVFAGAVNVPAHAKSGITERQTGALWSNRRPPTHLTAQDGDKWRMLPAECTHISSLITLSQHRNSHCQSGSVIYANLCKLANTCIHTHTPLFADFYIKVFKHTFIYGRLALVCV